MRRTLFGALACATGLALGWAPAHAAAAPALSVFARGVDNPRGLSIGADGTLYVASAGHAGPTCLDRKKQNCIGFSSRVLAIAPGGARRTVAKGLISAGGRDGTFTTGADGVSVAPDGKVYAVTTSGTRKDLQSAPKRVRDGAGKLFDVGSGTLRPIVALDELEWKNNFDRIKGDRNSNPYAVLALPDRVIVADAGANTILSVAPDGNVSVLAVLASNGKAQPVPTSLALGPDGAVYAGELSEGAGTGKARVWRIPLDGGAPSVYATGLTAITGLAFARDGSLYATELTTNFKKETAPGAIVKLAPGGGARMVLKRSALVFPSGAAVGADGALYVSNLSILPARTPRKSPFRGAGGQILRITGF
jgi:sugar lactone lactonase YvrE